MARSLRFPLAWAVATWLLIAGATRAESPSPSAATRLEAELLTASNAARAEHGLPALQADPGLARAARAHAAENAARGVLDHGSPDPARDTPLERIGLAGVALVEVGENLALMPGSDVAAEAVRGWLASPPHRANLLDPDFTHVGFGAADGPGGVYVAQLFGARPLTRDRATAEPAVRQERSWTIDVRGPAGSEVMLFVGSDPVVGAPLGTAGTARLSLAAPAGSSQATLGVATAPGRYAASDRVVLAPDGTWERVAGDPVGSVRIDAARLEETTRTRVEVTLAYEQTDAPLALLVDGAHRPEATARDGVLRTWLPDAGSGHELAVGVLRADGRIRVLERFWLSAGGTPRLVPGAPQREEGTP
jgi:uncharacterized protein YkwD